MTKKELCSLIAKREGKKHQASIGDIREILNILIDLNLESELQVLALLAKETNKLADKLIKKKNQKGKKK